MTIRATGWVGAAALLGAWAGGPASCPAVEKPAAGGRAGCEADAGFDFSNVPPVFPPKILGNAQIPGPSRSKYYSFLDVLTGTERESPPRLPFGAISLNNNEFFNYDFRYLDDPENRQTDWSDHYKRVKFCDDLWLFSTGGEFRYQYRNEANSRLTGRNNNFDLLRTRVYGDLWYKDRARVFVEGIYAESFNENLRALPVDDTGVDLLNAFAEFKLGTLGGAPVYVRGGRQQLNFGSQRLVSGLDWVNALRTFQGVRASRHGEKLDTDLFWVQPVVPDPRRFDGVTGDIDFMGVFNTYRMAEGVHFDLYGLNLSNRLPATVGETVTVGGRFYGDYEKSALWDFEAAGQWGRRAGLDVRAAMATGGLGWHFKQLPWNTTAWAYYDYASGDRDPDDGTFGTFNQLFPFGHYYLGYIDLVGRQNIQDWNFHLNVNPAPWILAQAQFHVFRLDSARAPLFNVAGVPIRSDPSGLSGRDVGNELDLLLNFRLSQHQNVLFGYSKLFAGSFLTRQGVERSPETFYAQYSLRW